MKSGKQRRVEIMQKRKQRIIAKASLNKTSSLMFRQSYNSAPADHAALAHVCLCTSLPLFYKDKCFTCQRCKAPSVWKAKDQKWWFETIKAYIGSRAVHCLACRKAIRLEKAEQKAHMKAMTLKKPHPNEAFFKKRY